MKGWCTGEEMGIKISQDLLLYLDDSTVFLFACLRIASKMKANVLTSRMEK